MTKDSENKTFPSLYFYHLLCFLVKKKLTCFYCSFPFLYFRDDKEYKISFFYVFSLSASFALKKKCNMSVFIEFLDLHFPVISAPEAVRCISRSSILERRNKQRHQRAIFTFLSPIVFSLSHAEGQDLFQVPSHP